jgi:large subunit ribosomal protein L24
MQATKPIRNPGKQRKLLYNAPAHLRHKLMAAPLSKELVASKGAKTLPVRKGDTVRILRGDHEGFEGKVSRVDLKRYRIFIEGLTREKVDGTNIFVSVHPSKVMIRNLSLDDKWRKQVVERKKGLELPKKEEKVMEKPQKKAVEMKEEVKAEKPVEEPKVAAVVEEKLPEKKPTARPKAVQKKPVAKKKKEEAPPAEEKPVAKKKKKEKPEAEEKPVEKEKKPKAVKKTPAKRRTAASKKEGGT